MPHMLINKLSLRTTLEIGVNVYTGLIDLGGQPGIAVVAKILERGLPTRIEYLDRFDISIILESIPVEILILVPGTCSHDVLALAPL